MSSLATIARIASKAQAQAQQRQSKNQKSPTQQATPKKIEISLSDFFRQSWEVLEPTTELIWNWHLQDMAEHVEAMFRDQKRAVGDRSFQQRIKNLTINVPPGSSKSRLVSVCTIPWWWLSDPSYRGLYLSGTPSVALRDAVWARDLVESDWYQDLFQPDWSIRADKRAANSFWTTAGGMRSAAGMTSRVTGVRFGCIVCDDLDDAQEVFSEVKRVGVHERWDNAIENRVSSPSTPLRIGICQRVHEDDWTGHVSKSKKWDRLIIRQEYDPGYDDPPTGLGWKDPRTEPGELLDPVRFNRDFVEEEKAKGSYYYSSQHQQSPTPSGGGMFQRQNWGIYIDRPEFTRVIMSVDASFAKGPTNDFCSLSVIGEVWEKIPEYLTEEDRARYELKRIREVDRYLIDEWHEKGGIIELEDAIKEYAFLYPEAATILIEEKANGSAICDRLETVLPGIERYKPGSASKESRAMTVQPYQEAGHIFLPADLHAGTVMKGMGVNQMRVADWWRMKPPGQITNDEFVPIAGRWKSIRESGSSQQEDGYVDEFAKFPAGQHDDRVDSLSQCVIWSIANAPLDFSYNFDPFTAER